MDAGNIRASASGVTGVKLEKRKRREPRGDLPPRVPDDEDEELDSPSKRPQRSDDQPLTAREIRALLGGHLSEMKTAWSSIQSRVDKVEQEQARSSFEVGNLQSRTRVLEKDMIDNKKTTEQQGISIDGLAKEVQSMKVKIDELKSEPPPAADPARVQAAAGAPCDPWAEFLRRRADGRNPEPPPDNDKGDLLSEEEKRTLVVGGWLQDTRRSVIEEEAMVVLAQPDIKALLDVEKVAVYGTIWCGLEKLGSATHRQPKDDEIITMGAGWISVAAVAPRASSPCARRRWGCIAQWNLAGQSASLADLVAKDANLLFVQELSRSTPGWDSFETDSFQWVTYRDADHWRGVGIAISLDLFDSVIHKFASKRGIWIVARIKGLGRVVLGSLHCHTGVTNAVYQAAVLEFMSTCPRKHRGLPLLCGVDANEEPTWGRLEDQDVGVTSGSSNLNVLVHEMEKHGVRACPPCDEHRTMPTHYPRDSRRQGRHIDLIFGRQVHVRPLRVDPERRHTIDTDHAIVLGDLLVAGGCLRNDWGNDSRARWVYQQLPADFEIVDEDDLKELATKCTRPRTSQAYKDDQEVLDAIRQARQDKLPASWKRVHRLRRVGRKRWQTARKTAILQGDWEAYRQLQQEKKRKRGWWGGLLRDTSSADLTSAVTSHLTEKMVDLTNGTWDDELCRMMGEFKATGDECFKPFTIHDVREELQHMKCRSAVGPDGIGVHLLREIASHDDLQHGLLHLINHIVRTQELPASWETSFLALLAKCPEPLVPGDLRPICVSSAFHKLTSRLVCARALPKLRRGSHISCCGRGRQSADLVGTISRLRDVTKEWQEPLLLCKLDVAGAFDRVDRLRIAKLLISRLSGGDLACELRYLLAQLHTHTLLGRVPGGGEVKLRPNIGIKQGAPESAELFGLVVDALLSDLVHCRRWGDLGCPFPEVDLSLLFYQDDVFLVETDMVRLAKRIRAVDRCLSTAGLKLAAKKTKIVSNCHYKGCRKVKIAEHLFQVAPLGESVRVLGVPFSLCHDASEQAKALIGRTRDASAAHHDILTTPGPWMQKITLMQKLVESQFLWIAGALHWGSSDLHALNVLQIHTCRHAFGLRRHGGETWYDWNARTCRFVRVWLHNQGVQRWSARVLTLQHTLHGHWARRVELVGGRPSAPPPLRALQWRCTAWWRGQQSLSSRVAVRHPCRFFASNPERQIAQSNGNDWILLAQNRDDWSASRKNYVEEWDVPWCAGRQLAIRY
ncbi:unnamed protein product [Symbiodinium sp. KB8]|nr:unnamed protein product [Symbiodinium sp. KB8]